MKWSLLELKKHIDETLTFSETLDLRDTLMQRNQDILDMTPVRVEGFLVIGKNEYIAHFSIDTSLVLPSSRSLEPTAFKVIKDVDEIYMTPEYFQAMQEEEAENCDQDIMVLDNGQLDLISAVEDHILLAIPLQVLSEEERRSGKMPKGAFWEVVSEEEYTKRKQQQAEEQVDSRLAKLSEFVINDEDSDEV